MDVNLTTMLTKRIFEIKKFFYAPIFKICNKMSKEGNFYQFVHKID